MEKIFEFLGKYGALISPIIAIAVGVLIPKEKVFKFVKKNTDKIPDSAKLKMAEYLDVIEQALINDTYNGDHSIVSNLQVSETINKAKIDLGLGEFQ
ncbi:hypothetical protein [uncultured Ilyobacter sp.]|uniref:hypothetical protein n=1 Tax=uncultured Ilyobacter sp. TaxID=544433 RepID=UPI0029C02E51|nr:hypothetical protein [uncultured Ilyobacter sp.]